MRPNRRKPPPEINPPLAAIKQALDIPWAKTRLWRLALLRPVIADDGHTSKMARKTEILSQDEINQLLRAINAGDDELSGKSYR